MARWCDAPGLVLMTPVECRRYAQAIIDAHHCGRTLRAPSDVSRLSLREAYEIQRLVLEHRFELGEKQIGWKIGYSSFAMRRQMNVSSPNFGPLTDAMQLPNGAVVSTRLVHPRVEPEIVVILGDVVRGGAARDEVLSNVLHAHVGLEVVDSIWRHYRFDIAQNTADGSSAAHVVCGPALPEDVDLASLQVQLFVDEEHVDSGCSSDAMGHPLDAVSWLASELGAYNLALRPGDVVLTGGLTAAVDLPPGSCVKASFGPRWDVSVGRSG